MAEVELAELEKKKLDEVESGRSRSRSTPLPPPPPSALKTFVGGSMQHLEDKLWQMKELEEALPKAKRERFGRRGFYKAKTGVGSDGFHPKVPLDLTKETVE